MAESPGEEVPPWEKVLLTLHNEQLAMDTGTPRFSVQEVSDILDKQTDITSEEVHRAMDYLNKIGLVTSLNIGEETFGALTSEGFQIAHEREIARRQQDLVESQNESNDVIATFTVILGVAALVQAAAAVFNSDYPTNIFLSVIYIVMLLALLISRDKWERF